MLACFIAYMVQAIVCNFAPLLFVGWSREFNITIPQLTMIVTVTFFTQIIVDFASAKFAERIGYKRCLVLSHACSCAGFIMLGTLPYVMKNVYAGIVISVITYSIGSGLLEVLISPVVESCPNENKAGAMSLLHSFYCWGTVFVIGVSTLYFVLFGRENWMYVSFGWGAFSLLNGVLFCFVPINEPKHQDNAGNDKSVFKSKFFYIAVLLMICSGASETAMSQWASSFAETALNVSKTVGDLAGPLAFAVLMGIGRIVFSKIGDKVDISKYMIFSSVMTIVSYLVACLSPNAVVSLVGCALCGFAVSAMWPATITLSTRMISGTSTVMFAFLALSGDVGCTTGPSLIGWISNALGADLKKGLIFSVVFPAVMIILLMNQRKNIKQ